MKNITFLDSIKCAVKGMKYAFKTEKNFKYYFFIALFFLILNILLKSTKLDYILYIIVTSGVLMAELANTAIEHVANAISGEYNEEIRLAKDIGSGIVLMQGFAFFIVEGRVFITKFVETREERPGRQSYLGCAGS